MKGKKALSNILVTILLILLTMVFVTVVWMATKNLILTSPIDTKCFDLGNAISIEKACYANENEIEITIKTNIESQKIDKLKFEFLPSESVWEITGKKCTDIKLRGQKYGSYCDIVLPGSTFYYAFNVSSLQKQSSLRFSVQTEDKLCIIEDRKIDVSC